MKRILFCVVPEKGHVNPCIGPAQHLQAADCEVAFYAPADISAQLEGAGDFTFLGPRETPERHDLSRGASFAANIRDAAWLRRWIHTLLIEYTPAQARSCGSGGPT
jgi:zeaxanthin glucosyltransferase